MTAVANAVSAAGSADLAAHPSGRGSVGTAFGAASVAGPAGESTAPGKTAPQAAGFDAAASPAANLVSELPLTSGTGAPPAGWDADEAAERIRIAAHADPRHAAWLAQTDAEGRLVNRCARCSNPVRTASSGGAPTPEPEDAN